MYTRKFYVLRDGIGKDFAFISNRINLNFLSILNKFRHNHRVFLGDFCGQGKEKIKFLLIGNYIHRSTR